MSSLSPVVTPKDRQLNDLCAKEHREQSGLGSEVLWYTPAVPATEAGGGSVELKSPGKLGETRNTSRFLAVER